MKPLFLLLSFVPVLAFGQLQKRETAIVSMGTTILAFITPDTAWLAADTKTGEVNTGTNDTGYSNQRKVYNYRNAYYGFVGIDNFNSSDGISFRPKQVMDSLLRRQFSVSQIYKMFTQLSFNKVNNIANWLYKNSNKEYKSNIGKELFGYIVIGYEEAKLKCFTVAFVLDSVPRGKTRISKSNDYSYSGDTSLFFVGIAEEAREAISTGKYQVNVKRIGQELPCLIKLEADTHPKWVGMPVDEFIIYKDGFNSLTNLQCLIP